MIKSDAFRVVALCAASGAGGACGPTPVDVALDAFDRVHFGLIEDSYDAEADRFRTGAVFVSPAEGEVVDGACAALPEDVRATLNDQPLEIYRGAGYAPFLSIGTPNDRYRLEPIVVDSGCFDPFVSLPTDFPAPADDASGLLVVEAGDVRVEFEFARLSSAIKPGADDVSFDDVHVAPGALASIPLPDGFDFSGSSTLRINNTVEQGATVDAGAVHVPMPQEPGRYEVDVAVNATPTILRCDSPIPCEVQGGSIFVEGFVVVDPS